METKAVATAAKLQKIRDAYLKHLPTQLAAIADEYERLITEQAGGKDMATLHRQMHTLRGSSASFGFVRLSAAASEAEKLLKEVLVLQSHPKPGWHGKWQEAFTFVEHEIKAVEPDATIDLRAVELVAANSSVLDKNGQKLIYLCEDDTYQRLTLTAQIECFGFRVVSFGTLEQLQMAVKNAPPDALVMDLIFPGRPVGGSEIISQLATHDEQTIPVVFVTSSNTMTSRIAAARAGSSAYFVKPVNVTELCAVLGRLTSAEIPEPCRILIVDDDPHLTDLYSATLQAAGMETLAVNNPLLLMEPLLEFKPDLILTDMYMPGCSGLELAKTVRQINQVFSIPIIFLSSETDLGKQFQAMRIGGDEFLTKPVDAENLVAAVAGRAERMKILRSYMVRDSMTGLYNHTAIKDHLETAVATARQEKQELCFVMLDLDSFKQINDNYGHSMGDQVLITLARLLVQRLKKTDFAGRYGGEEFALVLPGYALVEAMDLMEHLRAAFAALEFPIAADRFKTSFSCGVAALSRFNDADLLCRAADSALYRAKDKGRNRVEEATITELWKETK